MADYKTCVKHDMGLCPMARRFANDPKFTLDCSKCKDYRSSEKQCGDCKHYDARDAYCGIKQESIFFREKSSACYYYEERQKEMSVRKSCYNCKYYKKGGICIHENLCSDDMTYWVLSDGAKADLLHDAEPTVREKAEPERVKVKSICNNCFWWNKTCHNKKSCCYGEYKYYNGFCGWFEPANAETNVAVELFKAQNHDAVNHPSHYTQGGIECIDCIKATIGENFMGFLIGNVIEYTYQYKDKNGAENLKKARRYLDLAINELMGREENG